MTGATGFIGEAVLRFLLEEKHQVTVASRKKDANLPAGVKIVAGDISSPETFADAGKGADLLIHLAALITFDPLKTAELMKINGEGTVGILNAAKKWGIPNAVVASSACTIGISNSPVPLDERNVPATELVDRNPYMKSKLECEKAAIAATDWMRVVIVNPTTVYGAGDRSLNSGSIIGQVAKSKIIPVPPGGSNVVDVEDVAEGIILAAEKGKSGERYILGGHNLSFSQIFSTIAEAVSAKPFMIPLPGIAKIPMSLAAFFAGKITGNRFITPQIIGDLFSYKYFSSEKAKRDLGWKAQKSFSRSVSSAWKFYKENGIIK